MHGRNHSLSRKLRVLLICLMSAFQLIAQSESEPGLQIKFMTFNILHGATMNHDFDLEKIAKVIIDEQPDLVALQEVDYKTGRVKKMDLATELAYRTGMSSYFARAMKYDGGEYGEAILSKWSFIQTRNIPLPYSEGNEPRAIAEVTVVTDSGDTITFAGTHLDHLNNDYDRWQQVKHINKEYANSQYPSILAGDLNDIPLSRSIQKLQELWSFSCNESDLKATYPSKLPTKKIDYILHQEKDQWKVVSTKVICDTIASDHCALVVELSINKN